MQSTQAQITRMQQLIDGGSQREFHQLADVSSFYFDFIILMKYDSRTLIMFIPFIPSVFFFFFFFN